MTGKRETTLIISLRNGNERVAGHIERVKRENGDGEEIDVRVQLIPEIPEGSTMTSCVLPSRRLGRPNITIKSRLKTVGSVFVGGIKEQIFLDIIIENK